jgi:ATP-dependent RNA helicase RhlE
MNFQEFEFHPSVAAGVKSAGYTSPTPIQAQSIPSVMAGCDVMGLAQTGTGKTAAFVLPILHRLMQGERGRVRALIVAPTRELAEQINEAIILMGRLTHLKSMTIYGGVSVNPQIEKLKRGVDIIVACPGRLLDHLGQKTIDLKQVEVLVLDEADQMFDMGFLPDIRKILKHVPSQRQTLLFSATMPDDIRKLASDILCQPVTVQAGSTAPPVTVTHALYPVGQHLKTPLLLELLRHSDTESVLIFTRTKHRAKRLGEQLEKAGYKAASLQGNLSQNRRQAALDGFRDGTFQILVATDIAARGIDVSQISHVVNYDIPDTAEAYIHRIGRTGRAARSGDAFTLVTTDDTIMVRTIEKKLNSVLVRRTVEGFDYSVPAPHKDTEFARPPRPPQGRGKQTAGKAPKQGGGADAGASQGTVSAKNKQQAVKPAHPGSAPTARHPRRSQRSH